eukprot:s2742_g14.t1
MSSSEQVPSSLNVSSDSVLAGAVVARSRSPSSRGTTPRGRPEVQEPCESRRSVSAIVQSLTKLAQSSGRGLADAAPSDHQGLPSVAVYHQQTHYHDSRTQSVTVGVDPAEFGRVVREAQRLFAEADAKASSLEGLAQEIYYQACTQVQHLMFVAEDLRQSCLGKDSSIQRLFSEVRVVRSQLEEQIALNQAQAEEIARLSSEN